MVTVIGSGLESHIARQARKQAMGWIADAEHEAAQLVAQAAEKAEKLHGGAEAEAREGVQALRRRRVARAELDAREGMLRAQAELLDRVWAAARQRLAGLDADSPPPQRLARLRALTVEAAEHLSGGDLRLQLTDEVLAEWAEAWQAWWPGVQLSLSPDATPILGGVVVRQVNGQALVDNSYEQRRDAAREALRGQVIEILAQAGDGGEG
jgi:vacuolar-type H+-ATPase subunit E/Vma4